MENVTRDVITDLWPVYVSGEASPDTRGLVEAFLREDPEFARKLSPDLKVPLPGDGLPSLTPDNELKALARIQAPVDWAKVALVPRHDFHHAGLRQDCVRYVVRCIAARIYRHRRGSGLFLAGVPGETISGAQESAHSDTAVGAFD